MIIKVINVIGIKVIKVIIKFINVIGIWIGIIKFINVIVGLVSITPGHVKLDWLPPPKVDKVNDNPAHYQH